MAAPTDIELIRQLADVTDDPYDDDFIEDLIERTGSDYGAVALIWMIKAAAYAKQVSVSSGSTKIEAAGKHRNALEMATTYENLAGGLDNAVSTMVSVTMAPMTDEEWTEYTWGPGYWPKTGIWSTWENFI